MTNRFTYAKGATKHSSAITTYGGVTISIDYDAAGRETSRTATYAAAASGRAVTARDGEDRPTAWTTDGRGSTTEYDAAGKITKQAGLGWASDTTGASYTYDPENTGRKTRDDLSLAGTAANYTADYAYTDAGRLASVNRGGTATSYGFDGAGNLTVAGNKTFEYDSATNRLAKRRTSGAIDTYYRFDTLGRRSEQGPSDILTNVTYTWDEDSRLVGYRDTSANDVEASFAYDATGQRTWSSIRKGTTAVESSYVYDGITLLSVATTETVGGAVQTACTITDDYDEVSRPYAAVYAGTGAATPTLFHLTTNDRGDVLQALSASGDSVATYAYDAWGNPTGSTASSDPAASRFARVQPLRYAGYCFDSGTGLYYLSARYYDPATYQFLSKDPVKADGEESAYQYCGGDPIASTDPSGEWRVSVTRTISLAWMWRQWETIRGIVATVVISVMWAPAAAATGSASKGAQIARGIGKGLLATYVWGPLKEWGLHRDSNAVKRWGNPRATVTGFYAKSGSYAVLYAKVVAKMSRTAFWRYRERTVYWRGYIWNKGRRYAARWA